MGCTAWSNRLGFTEGPPRGKGDRFGHNGAPTTSTLCIQGDSGFRWQPFARPTPIHSPPWRLRAMNSSCWGEKLQGRRSGAWVDGAERGFKPTAGGGASIVVKGDDNPRSCAMHAAFASTHFLASWSVIRPWLSHCWTSLDVACRKGRGVRKRRRQMWRGGSQPPCIGAREQINMRTFGTIRRGCWARCWGRRDRPGQAAGWALVMACMALCVCQGLPQVALITKWPAVNQRL